MKNSLVRSHRNFVVRCRRCFATPGFATLALAVLLFPCLTLSSSAADFGAVADGDWNDAATWTPATGSPGMGDNAFVGSNTPAGSAGTATVTLTADQSVDSLTLGRNTGNSGTLDLDSFTLTLSDRLLIGHFLGGTGNLLRTTGHFVTPDLFIDSGSTLTMNANDLVANQLNLQGGAQVTTAAATNLTTRVTVLDAGSQLTLGAPTTLTHEMMIRSGGTVDLNNQDLVVDDLFIGWINTGGNLINDAAITVLDDLHVEKSTFVLDADDSITDLIAQDATVTLDPATQLRNLTLTQGSVLSTLNSTSVSSSVSVVGAGTQLSVAAPMTLTRNMTIRGGGTVDLNNQDLVVDDLFVGWIGSGGNLVNDAAITVLDDLHIEKSTFVLDADDLIADLIVKDATVTLHPITQVRNLALSQGSVLSTLNSTSVNNSVSIVGAGTQLTLAAPMTLVRDMTIRGSGTVDLNNQDLVVDDLFIGWIGSGGNLVNDAAITVLDDLHVEKSTFVLDADDSITDLIVKDATVTLDPTTQVRNLALSQGSLFSTLNSTSVNRHVSVVGAGTLLTLAAPMTLSDDMTVRADGTIDLNNHDLVVQDLLVGQINSAGNLINDAAIMVQDDMTVEISQITLTGGDDVVGDVLELTDGAVLTYAQGSGETIGLTVGRLLNILDTSVLALEFDSLSIPGDDTILRWANPNAGGDRVADINAYIASGRITVDSPVPFQIFDNGDGFTHVGFTVVPEPSTFFLGALAGFGVLLGRRK